jgi:starch phosphorylase
MSRLQKIYIKPELPAQLKGLQELSFNLWFSWHPECQSIFEKIDYNLWLKAGKNPVHFLQLISIDSLKILLSNDEFMTEYNAILQAYHAYLHNDTWFSINYPHLKDMKIAYFSAEFGVHESTPVYSGGLGLLAGDHCKEASDLGLPLVGVGLLYKQGYFAQKINKDGYQEAQNITMDYQTKTIRPVRHLDGKDVKISVKFPHKDIYLKLWYQQVGRMHIYFLDADLDENTPEDRLLTAKLYGGDQVMRISQEIILGIGGVKLLRELRINPTVWHINEGHAAFSLIERMHELTKQGLTYQEAQEILRSNTIFTTHTPVPAGHDVFPFELVDTYFRHYYEALGINQETFLSFGHLPGEFGFNMTKLAMKLANYINGVSALHGEVSRDMFKYMYPNLLTHEIPITYITNGVHTETWVAKELRELYSQYLDVNWYHNISDQAMWEKVDGIPDKALWDTHQVLKANMLDFIRDNISSRIERNEGCLDIPLKCHEELQASYLTIGFARRFATYKRAYLILKDKERLKKIMNDVLRPVRFVLAGKAHPADRPGQELIKLICDLEKDPEFRGKIVFVENYDINIAKYLLQGVDVWLNTPRRPLEASGTSGQKAAVNGVLNFSILDGWWPEGFDGQNGFALGKSIDYQNDELQDYEDSLSFYDTLEQEIIPAYYYQGEDGLPSQWIKLMKHALATLPWHFSTERMVQEYCNRFYIAAHLHDEKIKDEKQQYAQKQVSLKDHLLKHWEEIRFMSVTTNTLEDLKENSPISIKVDLDLGSIPIEYLLVEVVYGNYQENTPDELDEIKYVPLTFIKIKEEGYYRYAGSFFTKSGYTAYGLRVRPHPSLFAQPYELPLIKWADWN